MGSLTVWTLRPETLKVIGAARDVLAAAGAVGHRYTLRHVFYELEEREATGRDGVEPPPTSTSTSRY